MHRPVARLLVLTAAAALFLAWSADANLRNRRELVTKYPALKGTRLDNCGTCHGVAPPELNPFGQAWKDAKYDFAAIEKGDADLDKFTNRAELDSLTLPGDPKDRPGARAKAARDTTKADSAARDTTRAPASPDTAKKR